MINDVYIINLDKDTKRYELMKSKCIEQNINPIRIPAIYGKTLEQNIKDKYTSTVCNFICTDSTIGCALSHKKAWNTIYESGVPYGIILEDDVIFSDNVMEKINEYMNQLPDDWDIVYLGCHGACNRDKYSIIETITSVTSKMINVNKTHKIIDKNIFIPEFPLGTYAYIVSRKFCKNMSSIKINQHIDAQLNFIDINSYAVFPKIFSTSTIDSTIATKSNYPNYLLNYLSTIHENGIDYAWFMTEPQFQLFGLEFKILSYICIIYGILITIFLKSTNKILLSILLINIPEIIYSIIQCKNISGLFSCMFFNIIGILFGKLIMHK